MILLKRMRVFSNKYVAIPARAFFLDRVCQIVDLVLKQQLCATVGASIKYLYNVVLKNLGFGSDFKAKYFHVLLIGLKPKNLIRKMNF